MNIKSLTQNKIGRATVIIAVFSLLAKILGVVRDAVLSHEFGRSSIMDSYFAAFRIPDFIYNLLILGTFSAAFIPVFSEYLQRDKQSANKLASSIINSTLVMMLVLIGLAFILIDPLTHAIAPGFSGETFETTKDFTQIFLLSPLLFTLSSVASSILNTYKRFLMMSIAPLFYNLSIIAGAMWLYPRFGAKGLAWGVVAGAFLHFIVQVPQMFSLGFKYSFKIFPDEGFKKFWKLYGPRIFSMGTDQVAALIATIFGSFLGTGALAAFYYAFNMQSVFLGIVAVSYAIAVFPLLSDLYNQKDTQGFKDVLAKTSVQILFFIIPLSVLLLVLRAQAVRLILGPGQYTNLTFEDTRVIAQMVGLFSISLFAQGLVPLFTRAFYSMHNTITPVIISLVAVLSNIGLTYYFTHNFGIIGMALAFSLTSILHLLILLTHLHYTLGNIHDEYLIINVLKITIASLLAGAAAFVTLYMVGPLVNMHTYLGILIQAVCAGAAGVATYLFIGWALSLWEIGNLGKLLRTTASKIGKPLNIIFNWLN